MMGTCILFDDPNSFCLAVPTETKDVWDGVCESRYPCWKPELCGYYKCQGTKTDSSGFPKRCLDIKPWTEHHYCYVCVDCPVTSHDYNSFAEECKVAGCVVWLTNEGNISRACGDSPEYAKDCPEGKGEICIACPKDYCNYDQFTLNCIQCSYDNQLCTYDPMNIWDTKCDLPIRANNSFGCYSRQR